MNNAHCTSFMYVQRLVLTTNEPNLVLYEVHVTRPSTDRPTIRKEQNIEWKFQCPSSKQFTRKWLFIYEKLCPDATFNIQRAITTLTLLPLLPNEQPKLKQTTRDFLFLFLCLCVVFRCFSSSFLERFQWLNMAWHWGTQYTSSHSLILKMLSKRAIASDNMFIVVNLQQFQSCFWN